MTLGRPLVGDARQHQTRSLVLGRAGGLPAHGISTGSIGAGEAESPREALRLLRLLLPHRQRVQGPDHPATLWTRHDLARWTGETYQFEPPDWLYGATPLPFVKAYPTVRIMVLVVSVVDERVRGINLRIDDACSEPRAQYRKHVSRYV